MAAARAGRHRRPGRQATRPSSPAASSSGSRSPARWRCSPRSMLFDEPTSRARPRDDQRGARRDDRAGRRRHDDGRGHPRDGLRPPAPPTGSSSWTTAQIVEEAPPEEFFSAPAERPGQGLPLQDPHALILGTDGAVSTLSTESRQPYSTPARVRRRSTDASSDASRPLVAAALALPLPLTACGGDDDGADPGRVQHRLRRRHAPMAKLSRRQGRSRSASSSTSPGSAARSRARTTPRASTSRSPRSSPSQARHRAEDRSSGSRPCRRTASRSSQNGKVDLVVATYTINDERKRGRRLRRSVLRRRPGPAGPQGRQLDHRAGRARPARRSARSPGRRSVKTDAGRSTARRRSPFDDLHRVRRSSC